MKKLAAVAAFSVLLLPTLASAQSSSSSTKTAAKTTAKAAVPKLLHKAIVGGTAVVATCTDANGNVVPNVSGQPFNDPPVISSSGSNVSTNLDVKLFPRSVPVLKKDGSCVMNTFNLRMYGPGPGSQPAQYTYPGPTFLLNKPTTTKAGQSLTINLSNNLPLSNEACLQSGNPLCTGCSGTNAPQCCSVSGLSLPNCFHGNNTTNLHFHGTHVSPQSPQDYVLLELQPTGTTEAHAAHSPLGNAVVGSFTYAVNPIQANQSPGTHWYHPHKHGSTSQQVGNGMAGALIVHGEFDEEIQAYYTAQYGNPITDHVMVVQLVQDLNFNASKTINPLPLINGQLQPAITMRPGEIQRWRFINANFEGSAQITIDFNGPANSGLTAMQIAQDGIRLSPTNYKCQPLLNASFTQPCTALPVANPLFNFSPGNRADFLVQAPAQPGTYAATYSVFGNTDPQGDRRVQRGPAGGGRRQPTIANIKEVLELVAPGAAQPALLVVNVSNDCNDPAPCPTMTYPPTLSPMPSYLSNIPSTTDGTQNVQFRLDTTTTSNTPGAPGAQPQAFGIAVQGQDNGGLQQFDSSCANFTEPLGRTETWTVSQNTKNGGNPFHIFHIHTNPFQVVRFGTTTYPEPIWYDSITLPSNASNSDGFPTDSASTVLMRQRFEDYTGAYVLHCHFLGHEDRGMMMMVQTVCPSATGKYGIAQANGGADDCQTCVGTPAQCANALPACGSASAQSLHQGHTQRERKAKQ